MFETAKKLAEKVTGIGRPPSNTLKTVIRDRKAHTMLFPDDGLVPNHPSWPFIYYKSPVRFPDDFDRAAVLEDLFEQNRWTRSWRNGIYSYIHYHSRVHEVLGIAAGRASVEIGGRDGRHLDVKGGDVMIVPAGTGHRCLKASDDFLVVGAYPPQGVYDECRDYSHHHDRAVKTVRKVPLPATDPVYGARGPLTHLWRQADRSREKN